MFNITDRPESKVLFTITTTTNQFNVRKYDDDKPGYGIGRLRKQQQPMLNEQQTKKQKEKTKGS